MMVRTIMLLLTGVIKSPAQGSENERTVDNGFLLSCMRETQNQKYHSPKERSEIIKNACKRVMSCRAVKHLSLAANRDVKIYSVCD